ncbi:MAG: glycerophosphodiester phosphodiesterase [Chloroflexota bacterium]
MTLGAYDPRRRGRPLAVAHRGQRATYPEQTLEAYRAAIELGAEGIEVDVQLTRDGRLAMMHDLTLDRTTNGRGPIAELDWDDVRRLDAGSWLDPRFAGCRVPSLEETLDLAESTSILLCVEIKGTRSAAPTTALAVAALLRDRGLLDRVFVSGFDHDALSIAQRDAGRLLLAAERLPESGPADAATAVEQARALDATALQHRWEDLTTEVVDALHDAGVAVWTWPIDSVEAVERSATLGADAVIGDDVPLLLRALAELGQPTSAER